MAGVAEGRSPTHAAGTAPYPCCEAHTASTPTRFSSASLRTVFAASRLRTSQRVRQLLSSAVHRRRVASPWRSAPDLRAPFAFSLHPINTSFSSRLFFSSNCCEVNSHPLRHRPIPLSLNRSPSACIAASCFADRFPFVFFSSAVVLQMKTSAWVCLHARGRLLCGRPQVVEQPCVGSAVVWASAHQGPRRTNGKRGAEVRTLLCTSFPLSHSHRARCASARPGCMREGGVGCVMAAEHRASSLRNPDAARCCVSGKRSRQRRPLPAVDSPRIEVQQAHSSMRSTRTRRGELHIVRRVPRPHYCPSPSPSTHTHTHHLLASSRLRNSHPSTGVFTLCVCVCVCLLSFAFTFDSTFARLGVVRPCARVCVCVRAAPAGRRIATEVAFSPCWPRQL